MNIWSLFQKKQWQIQQADGSWLNISKERKTPGIYRFITFHKGVPFISPIKEIL